LKRSGRKSAAQTPAPKKERIYGSSKNPKGSAKSKSSGKAISLSNDIIEGLKKKIQAHNDKYPSKKVNLPTVKSVFRRGAGAYSSTHRPTITGGAPNTRNAWAYARVNKFLEKKAGKKVKAAYVQDDDLLKHGGVTNQKVICHRCSWSWNTEDSDSSDKYVCHNCGFDNSWYYGSKLEDKGLLDSVYRVVKKSLSTHGLIIDEDFNLSDGSNKTFLPYFGLEREDEKVKKSTITYYQDEMDVLGEIKIEVVDDGVEVEIEFPKLGIKEEIKPFEKGGFLDAINFAKVNLRKNGIVIKDDEVQVTLIAYNSGNQDRSKGLYNKALIYRSIPPIKQANQVIKNFDKGNYEYFDESRMNEYKNSKHLIIVNQNDVVYDSKNHNTTFKKGGSMEENIALPDSYSSYDKLKPILDNQGYILKKKGDMLPVGKLAKGKNLFQIAKMHGVQANKLAIELKIGIKKEMEHTDDKRIAKAIAMDHLYEDPKYYIKLKKIESKRYGGNLEGYYKDGGVSSSETCEVLDKDGERKIDKESIDEMTDRLNQLPQTKFLHFDKDANDYKPYRKRLHKDIIYELKKDLVCVERSQPIAILMGGSPASGKSTFLKKYAPYLLKEEIFKVDADEIRAKLPEYKGYNATQTHLETKDIVNTLLSNRNIGIPCRFDIIYDGTMNSTKSYLPLIDLLKKDGYKVFIVYINRVPKDVIVKRALERYKKSGRFVPLEVIDDFFEKGKTALEQLKKDVDGYMIIDGSNSDYKIVERGGKTLPKQRSYSKIGEPIQITEKDVIKEFKDGGEVAHVSGKAGGYLVGRRHSEGGIKAVNKSNDQPLEMEGGEVVITRNAVSDSSKREFEGEMLTNREILSRINQSGGGVSFAKGGDVPSKCACKGHKYKWGGKMMADFDIVNEINTYGEIPQKLVAKSFDMTGVQYSDQKPSEAVKKLFRVGYFKNGGLMENVEDTVVLVTKRIPTLKGFVKMMKAVKSPFDGDNSSYVPIRKGYDVIFGREGAKTDTITKAEAYKTYLFDEFGIRFKDLPSKVQNALFLGNQKLIDNYING